MMYGIETFGGKAYVDMVQAQRDTWAKALPRENLIIVGGPSDDVDAGVEKSEAFICGDKEGRLQRGSLVI